MTAVRGAWFFVGCSFGTAFLTGVMKTALVATARPSKCRLRSQLRMALEVATSDMQPCRSVTNGGHATQQTDEQRSDERSHQRLSRREINVENGPTKDNVVIIRWRCAIGSSRGRDLLR